MTLDRLYRDVENLKKQYRGLAGGPQLALSSIENGAIDSMDADGNLKMTIGQQDDGGNTINVISGPTPPTPVGFTVDVDHGKFIVHWSGDFDGDQLAPSDWSRAEVHASQDPFFVPSRATARGSIVSAAGGEVTIGVLKGPWTIKMLAWSQAGKMSVPSVPVDVEVPGYGDIVLAEIDAAETVIRNAGEVLVSEQGTLDEKLTEVDGSLNDLGQDLQAVEDAQAQLNTDLSDVMTSVDGKNTITWNPSAPSAVSNPGKAVGDLWYRTSGNSIVGFWKWDGTDWITQLLDKTTIPLIDIGAGTFGFMKGTRLEAGSVTADRLVVGVSQNLVVDPKFKNATINEARTTRGSLNTWDVVQSGTETWYRNKPGVPLNSRFFYLTTDGVSNNPETRMAVENTTKWSMSVDVMVEAGSAVRISRMQASLVAYKADGSAQFLAQNFTRPDGSLPVEIGEGWVTLRASYDWSTVSGVVSVAPRVYVTTGGTDGTYYFRNPNISEMVGTTLIEDGGITTPKLSADVLEVKNLKATTGQLDEAVINKLFSDVVVAKIAVADEFIGENAILTGAVTAPKITASEELWAKLGQFVKIRAEHIQSDAFDFMVARGGTYLTSGGNGSWSDNGLFISGPDGTSLVRFPTDGTPLSLTASDVQIDRASIGELDTTQQTVRSGGTLTLASGVTAPASPPELNASWERENQLPRPAESSMDWTGLACWNGMYVRGVNVLGSAGDSADRIEVYNPDGTLNKSISIDLNPRAGVAVIGDIVYTIGPDHVARPGAEKQWCHGFNLNTGERVSRWEYVHFWASNQQKIAIGADGTNLMVAGVDPNAVLYVFKYTPSTGALVGSQMTTNFDVGYAADIHGVGTSGGKIYVSPRGQVREYTVSGSTLTKTAGFAWDNPNWNSGGFAFVNGRPVVVDSGAVYTGSKFAQAATVSACFTWTNGTYETTPSPVAVAQVASRESVAISLPTRAGLQKNLYLKSSQYGGAWTKTTVPETTTSVLIGEVSSGLNAPPTQNTFPSSTPAVLKSGVGNLILRGDGSGRIGPFTFNADGSMTGIPKLAHGTVVLTPPADNTTVTAAVTFPEGRFSTPPTVVVSADTMVPGTNVLGVSSTNISETSFDAVLRRTNAVASRMYWIAMGE